MVEWDDIPALLERHRVLGLSLAYRVGDGPAVTHCWGVASAEDRAPVTPATLFQAGSISKAVTAFAALRLAAEGRLDVDADVNSVLTSWRLPAVWGWQPAVTVRMLLAHVADAVNSDAAPELLRGHPVQPRTGLGAFLTSAGGVDWWSHNGAVSGFEARPAGVAASARRFAVAIMTNGAEGGAVVDEVFRLVSERDGPGLLDLTDLFGESIGTFVEMIADQERMVGRYALPSGGEVAITAPMGEHVPEPHLVLPGQSGVALGDLGSRQTEPRDGKLGSRSGLLHRRGMGHHRRSRCARRVLGPLLGDVGNGLSRQPGIVM